MPYKSDFKHLWMPFTWYQDTIDYPPLVIESGSGMYLTDAMGRSYIDAVGSWWVSLFGHCHPEIASAVKEQIDKLDHVLMAGCVSEPMLRLSEKLGGLLPAALTRVFFSDDGSTAVEAALKIALQYHAFRGSAACEFVSLGGAYHGDTLGAVSVGGIPSFHGIFQERFKKQHSIDEPYCYRCPRGKDMSSCNAECMDSLAALLEKRKGRIAACIFEPLLQGAAGMRVYPAKALEKIFSLCKHFQVLTIADEVATGFGRTGKLFACQYADAVPDIMCLAKGLTGGVLPMGATAVQEQVFEEFKGAFGSGRILYHGHSFTGNPLTAAAACASMELLKNLNIPASLSPKISRFSRAIEAFHEYACVGDVRSIGLVGAIEFVKDRKTKEPFPPTKRFAFGLARKALDHGLLMRPLGDVLYFFPAVIITEPEIDEMFGRFHRAVQEFLHDTTAH